MVSSYGTSIFGNIGKLSSGFKAGSSETSTEFKAIKDMSIHYVSGTNESQVLTLYMAGIKTVDAIVSSIDLANPSGFDFKKILKDALTTDMLRDSGLQSRLLSLATTRPLPNAIGLAKRVGKIFQEYVESKYVEILAKLVNEGIEQGALGATMGAAIKTVKFPLDAFSALDKELGAMESINIFLANAARGEKAIFADILK